MTIVPGYWEWHRFRTTIDGDELDKYKELLRPYNPETHLKTMKIPILLQFGNMDRTIGKEERENFLKNIPPHAEIQIFNFGHNLNKYEPATIDRSAWIIDQFNSQ